MKVALIGLLQSGKSTLLSAISGKAMPAPGGFEIEEAIVPVPDERLDWLTELFKPKKIVHATIDCLDFTPSRRFCGYGTTPHAECSD